MKYEPIFGDQSLFRFGPQNAVSARYGKDVHGNDNYIFDSGEIKATTGQLRDTPVIAMRRIIKEPKHWTVEDQKVGRLPEVGSLIVNVETGDQFSFVGVNAGSKRWACRDIQDGFLYFFKSHEMSPIETPAEKAQRLKSEWCAKAAKQLKNLEYTSTLTSIYDALLSGELQAPKGGE